MTRPMPGRVPAPAIAILWLALLLAGCASVDVPAGAALATSGQAATAAMRTEARQTADSYALNTRRGALKKCLDSMDGAGDLATLCHNQPDAYASAAEALRLRIQIFGELETLYAQMAQLAAYDASADVGASFQATVSSIETLINTARGDTSGQVNLSALPQGRAIGVLDALFRQFAEHIKARNLKAASILIRGELDRVEASMIAYRPGVVSAQKVNATMLAGLQSALMRQGLADTSTYLGTLAQLGDLSPAPDVAGRYARTPRLRDAIDNYRLWETSQNLSAIVRGYDASVAVIAALRRRHEEFEQEQPLSLADLLQKIEALRATVAAQP